MNNLSTCLMDESNLNEVLQINNICFSPPWSIESLRNELNNKFSKYILLKNNHSVIGYAAIWIIIDEAHITNVAVHPDYRGIGGSNLLMDEIIKICSESDLPAITLEVRESNTVAINLYRKYGFVEEGMRKNYYGENQNAILMWKRNFL